ncbi:transcription factor ETV6-like isoform X2 [Ornithodoros turicata]
MSVEEGLLSPWGRLQGHLNWPLSMTLGDLPQDNLLPTGLGNDPRQWSKHNVSMWLEWCTEQFSLVPTDAETFHMNGKALCLLSKGDFLDRAPKAGDVLFNALQLLLHRALHNARVGIHNGSIPPRSTVITRDGFGQVLLQDSNQQPLQVSPLSAEVDSTVILSPEPSSGGESGDTPTSKLGSPVGPEGGMQSDQAFASRGWVSAFPGMVPGVVSGAAILGAPSSDVVVAPPAKTTQNGTVLGSPGRLIADGPGDKMSVRLLWDFLQQLLNDPEQRYRYCIAWKDQAKGVFKIVDPHRLAKLWGMQKNHLNMNFDKMSRAMRYYYRVKILQKEPGERLCYRFLRPPTELRYCKQRSLLDKGDRTPENGSATQRTQSEGYKEDILNALDMSVKDECLSPAE